MDPIFFSQALVQGILMGGIYGFIAMGLSLIFGVLRVINFAHGEMLTWGMYIAYVLFIWVGLDPFVSFLISGILVFLGGYLIQRILVNPIMDYHEAMQVLLLIGVSLVLTNLALLIWGPDPHSPQTSLALSTLHVQGVIIDTVRIIVFAISVCITLILFMFLKKTDLGMTIRATADNRLGARLVGVSVNHVSAITFGIGAACVGMSGAMLLPILPVSPGVGEPFTLTSFVIVILGGMGNLIGALIGGLIIGIAESMGAVLWSPSLKQLVSFVILILIMLFRPQGILGGKR